MEKQIESVYVPTENSIFKSWVAYPITNRIESREYVEPIKAYLYTPEEHAAAQQALSKAEDKGDNGLVKSEFNWLVKRLSEEGWKGFTVDEVKRAVSIPTQPTNSLDELERWVNSNWSNAHMIIYPKDDLLAKIQELKQTNVSDIHVGNIPNNSLDELEYYQAEREAFGLAVMNLDTETQSICDSFILAFDRLLNHLKHNP